MKFTNWLKKRAQLSGEETALVFEEKEETFAEVYQEVLLRAQKLLTFGVIPGMIVALLGKNNREMFLMIHALEQLGAVTVFINNHLQQEEINYQLLDSKSEIFLYDKIFSDKIAEISNLKASFVEINKKKPQVDFEPDNFQEEHVASIMYTSGTTGKPKGVMQTYRNHFYSAIGSVLQFGLIPKHDAWLCAVPLFHISGLSILMRSVIYGIPMYLEEKFDAHVVDHLLKSGRISHVSLVLTMLKRLLEVNRASYHPNLRVMLLGGSAIPTSLVKQCLTQNFPVVQSFGMTETASQIITLKKEDALRKIGSSGQVVFPAELRIMQDGLEACANELGEIELKGPNITIGYLFNEQATESAFHGEWFKTGDIGYLDNEGFLYVTERRCDLIISGGENIYPTEIEHVISQYTGIVEVAVVGKPDIEWGEVPVAYLVCKEKIDLTALNEFVRSRLAHYKIPKVFYFRESLPKTASLKVKRHQLKKEAGKVDTAKDNE
ncbi:o-succinylbenzoate--CoA ligase [Listeria sp. PSOL-1]|uniref:o-succinylbenzoate--CoA ligase n=1 Tax=Listeria sp. PSOL-1 TaxID=1844999 RepID=UPI0013D3885C|nr:o-succinylbenzoate--CoA ligase [Listeria sp. PSOL-1]